MKLVILAVGERLPGWAEEACADYLKRMSREPRVELLTVKPEKRAGQSAETIKAAEAARLRERLPDGARLVCLDEHGAQLTTKELAGWLERWRMDGRDTWLLIGGADGLAPELLARAEQKLALSRLTLPHALARVLLAEQLYRAHSLSIGHPYHRE
jgi:23S rRNA (pseudouridine1915-N3)-methyltransferase